MAHIAFQRSFRELSLNCVRSTNTILEVESIDSTSLENVQPNTNHILHRRSSAVTNDNGLLQPPVPMYVENVYQF